MASKLPNKLFSEQQMMQQVQQQIQQMIPKNQEVKRFKRTPEIEKHITEIFDRISVKSNKEHFNFDGSEKSCHGICIETEPMVKNILIDLSKRGVTEFTFLDVGGGEHGCAKSIKEYINKNRHLFPNIKNVKIVSLSGDCAEPCLEKEGICTTYYISSFKIEDLSDWINPDELIKKLEKERKTLLAQHDHTAPNLLDGSDEELGEQALGCKKEALCYKHVTLLQVRKNLLSKMNKSTKGSNIKHKKRRFEAPNLVHSDKELEDEIKYIERVISEVKSNIKKIEQIEKHLKVLKWIQKNEIPIEYNCITSSMCVRHLVDGPGTLVDMRNALKDNGILIFDGFAFDIQYDDGSEIKFASGRHRRTQKPVIELLHNSPDPFIVDHNHSLRGAFGGYVLQRSSKEKWVPDFRYVGCQTDFRKLVRRNDLTNVIVKIKTGPTWKPVNKFMHSPNVQGDETEFLKKFVKTYASLGYPKSITVTKAESCLLFYRILNILITANNDETEDELIKMGCDNRIKKFFRNLNIRDKGLIPVDSIDDLLEFEYPGITKNKSKNLIISSESTFIDDEMLQSPLQTNLCERANKKRAAAIKPRPNKIFEYYPPPTQHNSEDFILPDGKSMGPALL